MSRDGLEMSLSYKIDAQLDKKVRPHLGRPAFLFPLDTHQSQIPATTPLSVCFKQPSY